MTNTTSAEQRAFWGVAALLFAASAAGTIGWCASMSGPAMAEMPMPGGWTMSMTWMRMPGQTWPAAAVSFLGMWDIMMVAMMLPSLLSMLRRYRAALGSAGPPRLGRLTVVVGVGYFFVWTLLGMAAFPLGVALATLEMRQPPLARAVPFAVAAVVLLAGLLQLTAWKARQLTCCREAPGAGQTLPADAGTAWRHGLRLGVRCSRCCAGPMAILLVIGVMDLRAMVIVATALTLERLAPAGERVARGSGAIFVGAGLLLIARAAGLSLWFLALTSAEVAIDRVAIRVGQGGHAVPENVIRGRFAAGRANFESVYAPLVDAWALYDNSGARPVLRCVSATKATSG